METFSALLAICAGNSPVTGEFPAQRPVTRSFDAFFDMHLNKLLSKQWRGWWFETPSRPLWRHVMLCRGTGSPRVLPNQVQAGCRYTRLQMESLSISPYFLQAVLHEFNLFDDGCVLPTPDDADQQWDGEQRHRNDTYSHTQGVDCSWKFKYCHGIFRQ